MNPDLNRKLFIFLLVGALMGIAGGKWYSLTNEAPVEQTVISEDTITVPEDIILPDKKVDEVPSKVYVILKYIDTFHEPKDGYNGGIVFYNHEELLPKYRPNGNPIHYTKWDVNPFTGAFKRGPERLITGDNQSAWYTKDHYKSFIKIR